MKITDDLRQIQSVPPFLNNIQNKLCPFPSKSATIDHDR